MPTKRNLPNENKELYLTEGGMETTMVFKLGLDLPFFASCDLLTTEAGIEHVNRYYESYAKMAIAKQVGFIFDTVTWRCSPDWTKRLGYDESKAKSVIKKSVELCKNVRDDFETPQTPILISGCVGPRGDGYQVEEKMTCEQAANYHGQLINQLKCHGVDIISAITMNYIEEAAGIALACQKSNIPVVLSFTTEIDGRLPSGESLEEAILFIDSLVEAKPIYYMINCAHPSHFQAIFSERGDWRYRIQGIRANASCKSHAELDEATELDEGNPLDLAQSYFELLKLLPNLNVLGGCCGTDIKHIKEIYDVCQCHWN